MLVEVVLEMMLVHSLEFIAEVAVKRSIYVHVPWSASSELQATLVAIQLISNSKFSLGKIDLGICRVLCISCRGGVSSARNLVLKMG
jgi:hypothetical protein